MAWSRFSKKSKVLDLDRFAEIFGLNPVAFNGATFEPVCHYGCMTGCNEFWYQGPHQAGSSVVTRDDLANAIAEAERDLAAFWGIPIYPQEKCVILPYNGGCGPARDYVYNSLYYGRPLIGTSRVPAETRRNQGLYVINDEPVLAWGRQSVAELGTVPVQIYDRNGDLYTSKNNVDCPKRILLEVEVESCVLECEIEVYHVGHVCDRAYKIHSPRIEIADGIASIEIDPWVAIRPELYEEPADCGICLNNNMSPIIDLLSPATYPDELVVVRRYFDRTVAAAQFGWRGNPGCSCGSCDICQLNYCPGCVVGNTYGVKGAVQAVRGTWNTEEEQWCTDSSCQACSRDPDFVKLYYWHGYTSDPGCDSTCFDSSEAEQIVALLAAARLPKAVCQCTCDRTTDRFAELQATMNYSNRNEGSYFLTLKLADNPFGTRRGEVDAFRKALEIKNMMPGGMVSTGAF